MVNEIGVALTALGGALLYFGIRGYRKTSTSATAPTAAPKLGIELVPLAMQGYNVRSALSSGSKLHQSPTKEPTALEQPIGAKYATSQEKTKALSIPLSVMRYGTTTTKPTSRNSPAWYHSALYATRPNTTALQKNRATSHE